ncbi:PEP-utilizing enzyme [Dokdonella sp. MW10]|uniref:PEP-utilizing enzyme n=1 Tax=Dokdonella sp. MW10 TaxID=2992926 RepID=UPI003F805B41
MDESGASCDDLRSSMPQTAPGHAPDSRTTASRPGLGKSNALRWYEDRVRRARVPPFLVFTADHAKIDAAAVLADCTRRFGDAVVAVRSDAANEDGVHASRAGAFLSLLDIESGNRAHAIGAVVDSLPGHAGDRIMVQAMVADLRFAGVASTHRIGDGAGCYCIEMDRGDGAAVTGGRASGRQQAIPRALANDPMQRSRLGTMACLALDALLEVERLAGGDQPLEIEFALAGSDDAIQVWLLQVRPIASARHWSSTSTTTLDSLAFLERADEVPGIAGRCAVLSLMSDWNPAELLGVHPRPLALSLFEDLIGNGIWWRARAALGYAAPPADDIALLRTLRGRPFVDVRRSANSLLPAGLPARTAAAIVDAWIGHVMDRPELHDKVEFEVYRSIRDFGADDARRGHIHGTLDAAGLQDWDDRLDTLMRDLVRVHPAAPLNMLLARMTELASLTPTPSWPTLLDACRQGTFVFAALARLAFAGEAQLRSAIVRGALAPERALALRSAARSMQACGESIPSSPSDETSQGHLRPGSFEITRPSWSSANYRPPPSAPATRAFRLRGDERRALAQLLAEANLPLDADHWVAFVQRSSSAREWGKHVFTRHLSAAMDAMVEELVSVGLDREHASWLDLATLRAGACEGLEQRHARWTHAAEHARRRHADEARLMCSPVLRGEHDRYVADSLGTLPNFIGRSVIGGAIAVLVDATPRRDASLRGCIVVLRQADPGYDWLFDCGIAGLVTAWGGANSHLAIRCAEAGVSAAIGCGEAVHARACLASRARIDPSAGALWLD